MVVDPSLPLVSAIVPAYNAQRFVAEAIDSALAQTYRRLEVIVVDDGSTDGTAGVLSRYGAKIVALHQTNKGLSDARNRAVEAAGGKYVAFLDADDRWAPGKIEKQVAFLEAHDECGLVHTGHRIVDAMGHVRGDLTPRPLRGRCLVQLIEGNLITASSVMVRRALARQHPFRLRAAEDWDAWLRIAEEHEIGMISEALTDYRVHDANMTRIPRLMLSSSIEALDGVLTRSMDGRARRAAHRHQKKLELALAHYEYETGHFAAARHHFRRVGIFHQRYADLARRTVCYLPRPIRKAVRSLRHAWPLGPDSSNRATAPDAGRGRSTRLDPASGDRVDGRLERDEHRTGQTRRDPGDTTVERPLVSVIIPVFNGRPWVRDAVRSALYQSYSPLEIIVVDDGSDEPVEAALAEFGAAVRVYRTENRGVAAARNFAIHHASGDLIALLDQDDIWLPHKIERQVDFLHADPAVALVHSDVIFRDELGDRTFHERRPRAAMSGRCYASLFVGCSISASTVVVRRTALNTAGLFDERLRGTDDYDLELRISRHFPIGYLDERLAIYRMHTTNWSRRSLTMFQNELLVIEKAIAEDAELERNVGCDVVRRRHAQLLRAVGAGHFNSGALVEARDYLARSLRRKFDAQAAMWYVSTFLPWSVVEPLRQIKGQLSGRQDPA
jgi:glycosyltransferase involved in cell wall biosynthesis